MSNCCSNLVYPEDIDNHLNWPLGTAARLARRRRLPHYLLPDSSIRFRLEEVIAMVQQVEPHGRAEVSHA
jgi:hypothetical protein